MLVNGEIVPTVSGAIGNTILGLEIAQHIRSHEEGIEEREILVGWL